MTRPPPASPDERRAAVALVLLAVALRPLPAGHEAGAVRIDRAALHRLAVKASSTVGRNVFHATTAELAADENGDGWADLLTISSPVGNRRAVTIVRPDADDYGWTEVLDLLDLGDVGDATEAAQAAGLDTSTPLPAELLQPLPPPPIFDEDDDQADDDDEPAEPAKCCTKCRETKAAHLFAARGVDYEPTDEDRAEAMAEGRRLRRSRRRRSSWCRACTAAATRTNYDARRRRAGRLTVDRRRGPRRHPGPWAAAALTPTPSPRETTA